MDSVETPNYEKLLVWQEGMHLTLEIYRITKKYPKEELFGLISQLRRASSSIPLNIAEGNGRGTKEFRHFLMISLGSSYEVLTTLKLSVDLQYISQLEYKNLRTRYLVLIKQIRKLMMSLKNRTT